MIYNRPRRREKKRLTWYFNEKIYGAIGGKREARLYVKFNAGRSSYTMLYVQATGTSSTSSVAMVHYGTSTTKYNVVYLNNRWNMGTYRTIVFETEPVGELLTWLQANATPL